MIIDSLMPPIPPGQPHRSRSLDVEIQAQVPVCGQPACQPECGLPVSEDSDLSSTQAATVTSSKLERSDSPSF